MGDPSKASKELGWEATTSLEELVNEMIKEDLLQKEMITHSSGYDVRSTIKEIIKTK